MKKTYIKVKIQAISGYGAIFDINDMIYCNVNQFNEVSANEIKNKLKEMYKDCIFNFPQDELGHIDWSKITDSKVMDIEE